jgi:hypothetical protein
MISASRRRERPWTTLAVLVPPCLDILGVLTLIGRRCHHHRLPPGLLLCLFWISSFLRASSFFLVATIYQASAALSFLACWSSFSTEANLFSNFWIWKWTYIFSNYTKQLKSRSNFSPLWREDIRRCNPRRSRRSRPSMLEEEEAPLTSPHWSRRMKEEERCNGG